MICLVTGGAGLIGSHMIQHLPECDHEVLCLGNSDHSYDVAIKKTNIAPFLDDRNFEKDVVRANESVMSVGDGNIFNVANGSTVSINELAELMIELTGSKSRIKYKEPRTWDIKHSIADIENLKKIGFNPVYDLKNGLRDTIEWSKENESERGDP